VSEIRTDNELVNLAINYGGRAELVDAVNAILDKARSAGKLAGLRLDEEMISANLYTSRAPDPREISELTNLLKPMKLAV
jgi:undecaprenyl pyrophosphate synthase